MLHNFEDSLNYEKEQAQRADSFYLNQLKATDIKRFNTNSKTDMKMQLEDIDVLFTINDITYRVSEKFREKDFGDLYIEIFSKYPKVPGWLITGTPNAILYFTPKNIYWITHKSLKSFCLDKLFPQIPSIWFEELHTSKKTIVQKEITVDTITLKINLIQAHNQSGNSWDTIGISVNFDILERFGVKIKKYIF